MSDIEGLPSFDDLRYLGNWYDMIERYGVGKTIDSLILWQVLNHWDEDWWPQVLVQVFGEHALNQAKVRMDNPTPLSGRFLIIEGEDYQGRVKAYCERIVKEYQDWVLYDP